MNYFLRACQRLKSSILFGNASNRVRSSDATWAGTPLVRTIRNIADRIPCSHLPVGKFLGNVNKDRRSCCGSCRFVVKI